MVCRRAAVVLAKAVKTFWQEQARRFSAPTKLKIRAKENSGFSVKRSVGQPSPFTHPHLLGIEEVSPAASVKYAAPDVPYPFRQDSNFLYLCGFREPDSILAIYTDPDINSLDHCATLFVSDRDPHKELWEGPQAGLDGAVELTGVDVTVIHSEFDSFLRNFTRNTYLCYDPEVFPNRQKEILRKHISGNSRLQYVGSKPSHFVHKLRWIKSAAEADLMRKTCEIGSEALMETMAFSRGYMEERILVAKMDLECRLRGAEGLAYPPVVAGAQRANIIHYLAADQQLQPEDLVLMDAGCDYFGYVSDITRTWPVDGKFGSDAQRCLYEVLVEVHQKLLEYVEKVRPLVLSDLHQKMEILLGKQLQSLGLVDKDLKGQQLFRACDEFCPHHVSHYLGMDVHDTGSISRGIEVKPGVCITVEPGIYFDSENTSVPEEFRGIGLRIEDDVLITETGAEILTKSCPKSMEEIKRIKSTQSMILD